MVESGRVLEKGRNRPGIDNLRRVVLEKTRICVQTEKWWNPGECREKVESVLVSTVCAEAYRKGVESV